MINLLHSFGVPVNNVLPDTDQPLEVACTGGHQFCVSKLIELGASLASSNPDYPCPMFDSVRDGRIAVVEALLYGGGNPNATFNGMTALCVAVRRDDMALITRLILSGADVDASSIESRKTGIMSSPLHHAVETGSIEVVKYLLNQNANPDAVSGAGISVLMKAKQCHQNSILCMLLQRGADPTIGNVITGEPVVLSD